MHDGEQELQEVNASWTRWLDKWFYWLLLAGIVTNASGLLLPVMEPDGCLYAMISKTMVLSADFINLKVEGKDWLDKPHFPFWMAAGSFKIFGINGFAYKLPALIFWAMGARYIFLLAGKLYNPATARLSVIVYLAAEHLIISNNDVRAEPYLTGLIIAATYYYYRSYREKRWDFIIYGSLFLAAAVMTKGIFVAVVVASGFMAEWIIKRKWNEFLNPRWWLAVFLLLIFITPELYCLYTQFDLHPEKLVYGRPGVSGIHFFFLDSQFGRFFNTGPIQGSGDPLFYMHTLLWSFLPWPVIVIILLYAGITGKQRSTGQNRDYICPAIFISGFIMFSVSKFQLPHYLNILYPFLSIIVAHYLVCLINQRQKNIIAGTQQILYFLVLAGCIGITFIAGLEPVWIITVSLLILAFIIYRLFPGKGLPSIIGKSFCSMMVANLFLNSCFYPVLFRYQSGTQAAAWLSENKIYTPVYTLTGSMPPFAFEFYAKQPVFALKKERLDSIQKTILVYTSKNELDSLKGFVIKQISIFPHYPVSRLSGKFIYKQTRDEAIDSTLLVELSRGF